MLLQKTSINKYTYMLQRILDAAAAEDKPNYRIMIKTKNGIIVGLSTLFISYLHLVYFSNFS